MTTKETEMITVQEAAERLNVAESTLRHAIKMGKLKAKQIGKKSYVMTAADLDAWKANRKMGRPRNS